MNTKRHARIIASLRDDALSVKLGARTPASFVAAYDDAVREGVDMPADLADVRASLTQLVRVGGCPVGTVTTRGTVTAVERPNIDTYRITFDTGETKDFRFQQALVVITAA